MDRAPCQPGARVPGEEGGSPLDEHAGARTDFALVYHVINQEKVESCTYTYFRSVYLDVDIRDR